MNSHANEAIVKTRQGEQKMDLGITGRRALICGASSGLGLACAQALAAEGVQVTLVSRSEQKLKEATK